MYKSILEKAEREYEAQQRLLAALEAPREPLITEEHGPDEGVASASSDEEAEPLILGDSAADRQLLLPPADSGGLRLRRPPRASTV